MGVFQTLIRWIVPATTAQAMEAESRLWMLRCPTCGHETSLWDLGGIRYKASTTQRTASYRKCPSCGTRGWHTMLKRDQP